MIRIDGGVLDIAVVAIWFLSGGNGLPDSSSPTGIWSPQPARREVWGAGQVLFLCRVMMRARQSDGQGQGQVCNEILLRFTFGTDPEQIDKKCSQDCHWKAPASVLALCAVGNPKLGGLIMKPNSDFIWTVCMVDV